MDNKKHTTTAKITRIIHFRNLGRLIILQEQDVVVRVQIVPLESTPHFCELKS